MRAPLAFISGIGFAATAGAIMATWPNGPGFFFAFCAFVAAAALLMSRDGELEDEIARGQADACSICMGAGRDVG